MEHPKKDEESNKSQDDFLDALAALTLIALSVLLVTFILNDQPY